MISGRVPTTMHVRKTKTHIPTNRKTLIEWLIRSLQTGSAPPARHWKVNQLSKRIPVALLSIIVLLLSLHFPVLAAEDAPYCLLCQNQYASAGWNPQSPSVTLSYENASQPEGLPSLTVVTTNETRAVGVAYQFPSPMDMSNVSLIILWAKVQSSDLVRSLYLSIGDTNGSWRQFNDFSKGYALEPGVWTRIALDLSEYYSEGSNFALASIGQIWFGKYDGAPFTINHSHSRT